MPDAHPHRRRFVMRISRPCTIVIGKLDVQFAGMSVKRGPLWIPDGLHIWWGDRGVHLFWHSSPYQGRVVFDQGCVEPTIPEVS